MSLSENEYSSSDASDEEMSQLESQLIRKESHELLNKIFRNVITTPEIKNEFKEKLPNWIVIRKVVDTEKQKIIETQIDVGEASAICLSIETKNALLILDNFKARKIAKKLNLDYTGTIGLIVIGKLKGVIPSIKPYLEKIKNTNFRLPKDIETLALKEAKEIN